MEKTLGNNTAFISSKNIVFAVTASLLYLLISYLLIGFQADQLVLILLFNTLYFSSRTTRNLILAFSIYIIYWILFDYQKAFPNYRFNDVHIESIYNLEKQLFGINSGGKIITPNEYFTLNNNKIIDLLTGIFYLCWIPVPLGFAAYLYFKNKRYYYHFSLTFVVVNIFGWMGYYLFPAAPPWYVLQYGFDFIPNTPGHTAGLARFDQIVGVNIFEGIYAKSSNVFAAMPSLHAAYTLIVVYYSFHLKLNRWWRYLSVVIVVGIWFGAVYTHHHYILDVLAGILTAVLGIIVYRLFSKTTTGTRMVDKMVTATS